MNIKNCVLIGDSLQKIKNINNNQVDLFILDPPYFNVVNESWDKDFKSFEEYKKWLELYFKEFKRIGKKNSIIWLFGFPYQLSFLIPLLEKYNFKFKQSIVLHKGLKSIAGRSSSKLRMFPTATEYLYMFYYDSRNEIRDFLRSKQNQHKFTSYEINKFLNKATNGGGTWSSIAGKYQKNLQFPTRTDWNKLKVMLDFNEDYNNWVYYFELINGFTDVWDDINFYIKERVHPTQKPEKLIERIIKSSSIPNQFILDPFAGSGSTGVVCKKMNRNFLLIEKEEKYILNFLKNNPELLVK